MFLIVFTILILSFFFIKTKKKKIVKEKFINDNLDIRVKQIGNGKKVIIIDNFLKDPNKHINKIKEKLNTQVSQKKIDNYPGIRIKTPKILNEKIGKFIGDIATKYYNKDIGNHAQNDNDEGYSIVNFSNNKLSHGNIFPHVDCAYSEDKNIKISGLACVIYLCNTTREYNGTGFYEMKYPIHKRKFITDEKYKEAREIMKKYEDNPKYCIDKEEKIFKKLYEVDAKMNRTVIYPTSYFHQGIIHPEYYNDENNIRNDRYTYTGFVFFEKINVNKNDIKEPD